LGKSSEGQARSKREAKRPDSGQIVRYRRRMAVTPRSSVPAAQPGAATGLRLNMLPVVFPPGIQKDVVFSVPYTDDYWEKVREWSDRGKAFHCYRFNERIYIWPHSGRDLPKTLILHSATKHLAQDLPSAIVAYAVREAVVDHLIDEEKFERVGGGPIGQARLFRRRRNIAAQALEPLAAAAGKALTDEAGTFPYLAVQSMPFGERDLPGQVALVLDAGVINRLDLSLEEIAAAGIDLHGMSVVWRHPDECQCGFADLRGVAGTISGGDARAVEVTVAGRTKTIPGECLRPRSGRRDVDHYFSEYLNDDANVARMIRDKIFALHDPKQQWAALENTRRALSPLTIFSSTEISFGEPIVAGVDPDEPVRRLPDLSPPDISHRYGSPIVSQNAAIGLNKHGPWDSRSQTRVTKVRAVILYPAAYKQHAERLRKALVSGLSSDRWTFPGLAERYELEDFVVEMSEFPGRSHEDYAAAAHAATRPAADGKHPDVCFVITQRADRNAPEGTNPYLAAKAPIVMADIAAQGVTIDVIGEADSSFIWSIQAIALQVYAKLGNVPYVLHDPDGTAELVLGIGRHDLHEPGEGFQKRLFGAAAAFRQDGDFLFGGSTAPVTEWDDYENTLAGLVQEFVERYEREQATELRRLTLHVFKRTGSKELYAVKRALGEREVSFALVHVNRDTPLWLVSGTGNNVAPAPVGSLVSLAERDRLLMTGSALTAKRRSPHPLRLTLDGRSTFTDMARITTQIQGFTATSWRGFQPTHEPSTILYGRLLAEKVGQLLPYGFDPKRAAAIGDRPWFL
jgi:hypothetical protein